MRELALGESAADKPTLKAGAAGFEERGRRPTFFLQFTVIFAAVAFFLSLAVGLAVTRFLSEDIRKKNLDDLEAEVSEVTAPRVGDHLPLDRLDQPLTGAELAAFGAYVEENILSSRTVRVNVWNRAGTIVYSSYTPVQGSRVENDSVSAALSGGTETEVESPGEEPELVGLSGVSEVVNVYVPLIDEGSSQPAGVLEVYRDFTPIAGHIRDVQKSVFFSIAAALATLYLALVFLVRRGSNIIRRQQENLQHRSEELKSSYESIVAVLCAALDLRDNVTHGHAQRVAQLATVVAWQMGLRKEEVRRIEKAAILHDIGKLGVADSVLSKPGALDDTEWAEMKRHPELGFQILEGIDFLQDVAEVVYSHHERFDGSGYPRGLKWQEIPLGARIFAVVDAYDAMTSHRPYRKAMPHSKAVEEIIRNSGSQFDPEVVTAFLEAEKRGLLNGDGHGGTADELAVSRTGA